MQCIKYFECWNNIQVGIIDYSKIYFYEYIKYNK